MEREKGGPSSPTQPRAPSTVSLRTTTRPPAPARARPSSLDILTSPGRIAPRKPALHALPVLRTVIHQICRLGPTMPMGDPTCTTLIPSAQTGYPESSIPDDVVGLPARNGTSSPPS